MAEKLTEKEKVIKKESLKIPTFWYAEFNTDKKRSMQKPRQIDRVIMETATQNNVYRTLVTRMFVTRTFVT